jgi:hypothetical protein
LLWKYSVAIFISLNRHTFTSWKSWFFRRWYIWYIYTVLSIQKTDLNILILMIYQSHRLHPTDLLLLPYQHPHLARLLALDYFQWILQQERSWKSLYASFVWKISEYTCFKSKKLKHTEHSPMF